MKSDLATVRQRVEEILSLRLLGAEFLDIRQHASAQGWNVSDRQLRRYVSRTDDVLAETLEKDREKLLNRHIAQRHALYARAMSVSDYSTALRVLADAAQLLDLYPAKKSELTGKGGAPVVLQVIEQIVGEPPAALPDVAEEIVTLASAQDHPPAQSATSIPAL